MYGSLLFCPIDCRFILIDTFFLLSSNYKSKTAKGEQELQL